MKWILVKNIEYIEMNSSKNIEYIGMNSGKNIKYIGMNSSKNIPWENKPIHPSGIHSWEL